VSAGAEKCLFPECKNEGRARGLCTGHQQAAMKLVKANKVTWEQLEAAGKAKPKRARGKVSGWFLEAARLGQADALCAPRNLPPRRPAVRPDGEGRLPQDPTPDEIKARAAAVRTGRK
jgi:hypothetical protein